MVRSRSYIATPPGATIKEQLDDRAMSQKEFAVRMDLSEKHVSRLINGEVQLTSEMAVRLEMVLGAPASFWSNLEAVYREKIIKARTENAMERDLDLARQFPYSEMAKLGWIPKTRDAREKVINLRKFFEVVELSLLENAQLTRIACRRLRITDKSDLALMAWAQEAKIISRGMDTAPVHIGKLTALLPEIRKMTLLRPEEFCPKLKESLAGCGIALVFLPHLKGSFLQGATFADSRKIIVGLTVRGKDADKFWFSLFHELGHIVLGHTAQTEGITVQDEENANAWAGDTLIPPESFIAFKQEGDYSKKRVRDFARILGIAPGIVVGRMQKENLILYSEMNDLKERYMIAGNPL